MKITIFNGSPRGGKSNTHVITSAFAEGASSAGARIENVFLIEKNINHCTGCFSCWNKTPGQCIYRDDMDELLKLYLDSDIVCFATPVYLWNMTASLKNFLDRLIPTKSKSVTEDNGNFDMENSSRKIPGVIIISNAGFPGNNNFDTLREVMKSGNPILEIYRNCGMILQSKEPEIQERVQEYLNYVREAGAQTGAGQKVSEDIIEGLNMELLPISRYLEYISG